MWIALHLATAHASGRRDDLAAHLEAGRFDFPEDMPDCEAGREEAKRVQYELEVGVHSMFGVSQKLFLSLEKPAIEITNMPNFRFP